VNPIDIAAIVLLLVGAALGFRSGAFPQLGGLAGAIGGAAIVLLGLPFVIDALESVDPAIRPFIVLVALLVAVILGESIGSTLGRRLTTALGTGVLGAADRVAGAFIGVAQAVLIIWLVGGLLAIGPVPRLTEAAQTSKALRALGVVFPPPADFALELGRVLDATGLPAVFVGFEPIPAAPVDRPDDPTAKALAKAALASVVKVSTAACGYTSSGTGFAVAGDYVVTNAHVVAGATRRSTRVTTDGGKLLDADVVLFDPELDVAVLHVAGLDARPLRFAAHDPARGALGASIGYPGGGNRVILPAAVAGAYPAVGRDIYDQTRVKRDILELRAEVDRGDSGGPLILKDGTVGGVVFAESRTDDQVGYALAPTPVATRIEPAIGRTTRVDTGECIR
jgi:S1-C subfamily serine protease